MKNLKQIDGFRENMLRFPLTFITIPYFFDAKHKIPTVNLTRKFGKIGPLPAMDRKLHRNITIYGKP